MVVALQGRVGSSNHEGDNTGGSGRDCDVGRRAGKAWGAVGSSGTDV